MASATLPKAAFCSHICPFYATSRCSGPLRHKYLAAAITR
ncbi:4Fe-4S binding protein [Canibacter oris]